MHSKNHGDLSSTETQYIQEKIAGGYGLAETLRADFKLNPLKVVGWLRRANENSEIQQAVLENK